MTAVAGEKMIDRVEVRRGQWLGVDRIYIQAPYKHRLTFKALPSALWDGSQSCWHIPWSAALVPVLREALVGLGGVKVDCSDEFLGLAEEARKRETAQEAKSAGALPDLPTKTEGWLHQRRVFHFAKDLHASALFVAMGGGKSAVAVGLCEHDAAETILILCPKSVMGVWAKQFAIHGLRDYDFWVGWGKGTVAAKAHNLATFLLRPSGRPKVVVVNYDSCWRTSMGELLLRWKWDVEILDESHKIKAPGGKASRYAAKLRGSSRRVLLLTGTPQPHGPGDIYAQYRAADPGIFGTNFALHKRRYFATRPITEHVDKIEGFLDEERMAEFQRKMGSIAVVVTKEDMVGAAGKQWALPHVERQVELDAKTWRTYLDIRNELVAEVKDGIVTADNILVKGLRLRQITSGFARTEDGIDSVVGTEKQQLLTEILDDIPRGEPVVVFAVFHHDLDAIRDATASLGLRYGELSGRRRDGLSGDSTLADSIDVMGCQLQSGGVGIDLTRSAYGVYYSIDYNLGNIEQSFARLDRPGQTRPVTFIHLVAVSPVGGKTVDGVTYQAVEERRALNEAVMEALRSGRV